MKHKTCYLYLDGVKQFDVLQYALDRNIMLSDAKKRLENEYCCRKVEFKVERMD